MTYTVQKGDTLSSIASRLGVDWKSITGFRSGNPSIIYVGETLTVPDKKAPTPTQKAPTTQTGGTQATAAVQAARTKSYQAPPPNPQPYSQSSPSLWQNIKDLPKSVVEVGRQIVGLAQKPSEIIPRAKEAYQGVANLPKSVQELGYQLTGGGAKTFGDLMGKPTTPQTATQNRPVVELASAGGGGTGGGGYPAGYGPNDINPATGKPWGLNPKTGKIDMAYYQSVMQNLFGDKKLSEADQAMLDKLKYSSLNATDFLKSAKEELTPYYERLLKEANYDIDVALKFLQQDYDLGLRQGREVAGEALGNLMPSVKAEQRSLLGALNKQGILTTPLEIGTTPTAVRPDTGATLGGETVRQFGGLAGKRLAEWQESAQARIEAITRALKRQEESSELEMAQQKEAKDIERQRKVSALERDKQEKTATLAETNYGRALRDMQLKREEILRPYS